MQGDQVALGVFVAKGANWLDGRHDFDMADSAYWMVNPTQSVLIAVLSASMADC